MSALGELRPSRLIELVAHWLAAPLPAARPARTCVRDFTLPQLLSNDGDAVKRLPYFCAGCPHNTSTKVPEGSRALAGIGCHFMASWMDRDTEGLIQMGGEGVDWVAHSMFTKAPHVFQNLGDGTYYHSGYLAIRQAIAAEGDHHLQDPLQRRGRDDRRPAGRRRDLGRPRSRARSRAEGVKQVVVVSDDIEQVRAIAATAFPPAPSSIDRGELDAVQRGLREIAGRHGADLRTDLRRREAPPPQEEASWSIRRSALFINEAVCEGCGDCSVQSNCVAVLPLETELGRKRQIDQIELQQGLLLRRRASARASSACIGGALRKKSGALRRPGAAGFAAQRRRVAAAGAACTGPARTTCSSPASAAPAWSPSAR